MVVRTVRHRGLRRLIEEDNPRFLRQNLVDRVRKILTALILACISHHPTVEAHDTTARTSLRLLAVLNVLFKYACARQAARASS